jgi:hypothetical protein
MPKYYVKSGQIRYIIDCNDQVSAILSALYHFKGRGAITGPKICVSECGFDSHETWKCYNTDEFLKKL